MKKIKRKQNRNNRFLLNFVTSYSIILLFILIMGFFFYYSAISNAESSLKEQNASILEANVKDADNALRLFSTLSMQISSSSSIKQLLYTEEKNGKYYLLAKSAMNYLKNIMSLEETLPITNYYVYFPNTKYFLSSTTFSDAELFYLYNKQYKRSEYNHWMELVSSYDNLQRFIPLTQYKDGSEVYLYKQVICANLSDSVQPGILYIEISKDDLYKLFSTMSLEDHCSLYVTNAQGEQMFSLMKKDYLQYDPKLLVDEFENHENSNDISSFKGEYYLTKLSSSYNKWDYYLIQPASILLKDFYLVQKIYLCIILFTCAFTLMSIYLLSKRNVRPIIQMNNELEVSKEENKTLHTALEIQKPYVYNSYLSRIMKGHIFSSNDLKEITEFLNLDTTNQCFSVLYCKVKPDSADVSSAGNSFEEPDVQNFKTLADYADLLMAAFRHYFGEDVLIYKSDFHVYALLLTFPSDYNNDDFIKECEEKFIKLHKEIFDEHHLRIYAGFGKRNSRLAYVWESYQQAKDAVSYARQGNIFQNYKLIQKENTNYYYPLEMATQLTNFIRHNNSRQIIEIFKILRRENFEYRTLSSQILHNLVDDVKNTIAKARFNVQENKNNDALIQKIDLESQKILTFEDVEKLALLCCSLYEKVEEKNPLINNIETYINQNYADSSLCLKKISNDFSISESYFSTLFKAETKQNFSDYLETLRMGKAMYLVKSSDISLSDIYLEVGYNNANSFRRAFKKIFGVSPKTVRDSIKNNSVE